MALSKTTQDHEEIQQWAEARGAVPAEVASTEKKGQTGILRFEFPGAKNANDSALKEISWDEFFEKFDASGLALVYQEKTAAGQKSNFNKLVHPENAKPAAKKSSAKKSSAKKSSAKKSAAKNSSAKKSSGTPARKAAAAKKAPAKKSAAKKTATKTGGKSARSSAGRK